MAKRKPRDLYEKHGLKPALPPPEDQKPIELPFGCLIHVYPHPDHIDERFDGLEWPPVAVCPPDVGDHIVANNQTTIGEVLLRVHRADPVFGAVLSLAVKIVDGD